MTSAKNALPPPFHRRIPTFQRLLQHPFQRPSTAFHRPSLPPPYTPQAVEARPDGADSTTSTALSLDPSRRDKSRKRRACGAPTPSNQRGRQRRFPTSFFLCLQIWCAAQARAACGVSTDLSTCFDSVCIEPGSLANATQRGAAHCAGSAFGPSWSTGGTWRASRPPGLSDSRVPPASRRAPPLRILGAVAGRFDSSPCLVPTTPSTSHPPRESRP